MIQGPFTPHQTELGEVLVPIFRVGVEDLDIWFTAFIDTGAAYTLVSADVLRAAGWDDKKIRSGRPVALGTFAGEDANPQEGWLHSLVLRIKPPIETTDRLELRVDCVVTEPLVDDVLIGQRDLLNRVVLEHDAPANRLVMQRPR